MSACRVAAVAGVLALGALLFGGCGGATIADVCQKECDCRGGCTPKEEQACEKDGQEAQDLAHKKGCDAEFSDVVDCADSAGCNDHDLNTDACSQQIDAFSKCTGE